MGTYDLLAGRKPSWKDLGSETDYESQALSAGFKVDCIGYSAHTIAIIAQKPAIIVSITR